MARLPPETDTNGDARGYADPTASPWFALYEERLAKLAEEAANGAADTDLTLSEIVDSAPQDMRSGLVGRFRALLQEKTESREVTPAAELTPEQERIVELLAEHEQAFLAHVISKKRLEKIRRAMMMNPQLLEQVLGIGEELVKRGMLLEQGRIRRQAEIDAPVAARHADAKREPERER